VTGILGAVTTSPKVPSDPKDGLYDKSTQIAPSFSESGLKITSGQICEEFLKDLSPEFNRNTYLKMSLNSVIASVETAFRAMIRNTTIKLSVDRSNPTAKQKKQIKFLNECMGDMTKPFSVYLEEALSSQRYGFHICLKKWKKRDGKNSIYNDGKWGWHSLPTRSQHAIKHWWMDEDFDEVLGCWYTTTPQSNYVGGTNNVSAPKLTGVKKFIPRNKFIHFVRDQQRGNPEGTSAYRGCYSAWSYLTIIEKSQALGIQKDSGPVPKYGLPAEYFDPNADEDKKLFLAHAKQVVSSVRQAEQFGVLYPRDIDEDTKQEKFKLDYLESNQPKTYDTEKIITSYENKILMTFLADLLKMGQDKAGSLALSDNKNNLLEVSVKTVLQDLLQPFNDDLIKPTLAINGWDIKGDTPKLVIDEIVQTDLDVLGKFIQQVVAVKALEVDEGLSEWIRGRAGMPPVDRNRPIKPVMTSEAENKVGEGMKEGMPNGTGASTGVTGDANTANKDKS